MTGRASVPAGAAGGRGSAIVRVYGRRVCWSLRVHGIDRPRAAHINKAIPGEYGPVMVKLGKRHSAQGCTTAPPGVGPALVASPRSFHVVVSTRRHPTRALLGQLHTAR